MACGASGQFEKRNHLTHWTGKGRLGLLAVGLLLMGCTAVPVCPFDRPVSGREEEERFLRLSMEEMARCIVAWEPERFVKGPPRPYRGKVVDAETGGPITGAVVIAVWEREFTGAGGRLHEFYDAQEVLTDQAGEFVLDASEIEARAPYNTRWPAFRIYKPGYGFYPRYQVSPTIIPRDAFRQEVTVVRLRRLLTKEERLENLNVQFSLIPEGKQKQLLRAINAERRALGLSPYRLQD